MVKKAVYLASRAPLPAPNRVRAIPGRKTYASWRFAALAGFALSDRLAILRFAIPSGSNFLDIVSIVFIIAA